MADVGNSFAIANLLPIAHANVDIEAEQKAEVVLSAVQPKTPQLSSTEPIKLHTRPLLQDVIELTQDAGARGSHARP